MAKKKTRVKTQKGKDERSAKYNVFICFDQDDMKMANEICDELTDEEDISVIPFGEHVQTQKEQLETRMGQNLLKQVHQQIRTADVFLLLISENVVSRDAPDDPTTLSSNYAPLNIKPLIEDAYYYALFLHRVPTLPSRLLKVFIDSETDGALIPAELATFEDVDYRDPHSRLTQKDNLLAAVRGDSHYAERRRFVSNTLPPNPGFELFKRVLKAEFGAAFEDYMRPIRQSVDKYAAIAKAQDNLMTPELISLKEASAFDDIWVVSQSLHNDLHDDEISDAVKKNYTTKGIRYTYFVPKNAWIERKVAQLKDRFKEYGNDASNKGEYDVVYLESGEFMPFDEMVIYDGDNATQRWGYFQMSHDKMAGERLLMRIPDRSLSTIITYLRELRG